jgi:hypothetical protein
MSASFNRYCRLLVGDSGDSSALDLSGLRIVFEIEKSAIGYPSKAKVLIYNLSNSSRQRIRTEFDRITLEAGYEDDFGVIFQGEIFNVFNRREQPEYVTEIYASDGGFNYRESYTSRSYGAGVTVARIVSDLRTDMNLDVGQINADLTAQKIYGWSFTGDTTLAMNQLAESHSFTWFIQAGKLYVTGDDESVNLASAFEITAESGMIGSPVLTERGINVKTLLNWQLIPNEEIKVVALSQANNFAYLNINSNIPGVYPQTQGEGTYIARRFVHRGDTRGNDWYTDIEGYFPPGSIGANS